MSIGAKSKDEGFNISPLVKVQYLSKKFLNVFLDDFWKHMLQITLVIAVIGSVFYIKFPTEFYIILVVLSGIQIYRYFQPQKELLNEIKKKE